MPTYPTVMTAEFRGYQPPSQFRNRDGELIDVPARLKVERQLMDDDVEAYEIPVREDLHLDGVDPRGLKRGEMIVLSGDVVVHAKGGFVSWYRLARATANGATKVPAAA